MRIRDCRNIYRSYKRFQKCWFKCDCHDDLKNFAKLACYAGEVSGRSLYLALGCDWAMDGDGRAKRTPLESEAGHWKMA
jgi:hypothetical protein